MSYRRLSWRHRGPPCSWRRQARSTARAAQLAGSSRSDARGSGGSDAQLPEEISTPQADGTVRTIHHAAQYALAMGMDARTAEDFIRRAMARQDMIMPLPNLAMSPGKCSPTTSTTPTVSSSRSHHRSVMRGYADRLSPQFRAEMVRTSPAVSPRSVGTKSPSATAILF